MRVSPASEASIVGRVIDGRYRVTRHLADGGMGSVFVAIDERLERDVALKVMRADLARDDAFVARFRREARSAARLGHPNVVAVTDQGSDGQYAFLAMELVLGDTLRQLIRRRGPLPVDEALGLMDPILDGLAAAHRAGLVHRDVKPENVLISQTGQVKVTDFGLARAVTTSTLTGDSDILLGTASYLSPEQVEHGTADARSDVYSAGLLLFEILTGEKAFPGDSPIHVAYQHVHGTMPRASDAVCGIPDTVDDLIAQATAKDPDDRPATAADLLVALRTVRRGLESGHTDHTDHGDRRTRALPSDAETTETTETTDAQVDHEPVDAGRSHTTAIHSKTNPLDTRGYQPGEDSRRPRRGLLLVVLSLVALLLLGAAAAWAFTSGPLGSTKVPTVNGLAQGSAVERISKADLKARVRQTFSESVAQGRVIRAEPGAGSEQRKNSTVTLTVSKGPERFSAPKLAGSKQAAARAAITKAQLGVGTVTQAFHESVPTGSVISSTPAPGTALKKGAKVNFVVSKGKQPVPVPNVAGQPRAEAEGSLTRLGLKVAYGTEEFSETVAKGSVIRSTPASGANLYKGDSVELIVSKGPEMVQVPRVIDMKSGAAKTLLESQGFTVELDRFFGGLFDTVRDQSLRPGTSVKKGSTITLSIV